MPSYMEFSRTGYFFDCSQNRSYPKIPGPIEGFQIELGENLCKAALKFENSERVGLFVL